MAETDPNTPVRLTGGCQCGAVRYELSERPRNLSICHCRMCQKASGGPYMAMGRAKIETVTWTRGKPSLFQSSSYAWRGFCAQCGTPLFYQRNERAISLTLGSFDDPTLFAPEVRFGVEGVLPWTEHIAELPSQTTEEWMPTTVSADFHNHQHPDQDAGPRTA